MARNWTDEDRKRQSELMHRLKPWTRSTGPRTAEGKARSSRNAVTHGCRTAAMRDLMAVLRAQRAFREGVMARLDALHPLPLLYPANELLSAVAPMPRLREVFSWISGVSTGTTMDRTCTGN